MAQQGVGGSLSESTTKAQLCPAANGDQPIRVAQVIASMLGGAGRTTLRSALTLDPDRYANTILAPDGPLLEEAEEAGLEVIRLKRMGGARKVYFDDAHALLELKRHLKAGRFDIVHTNAGRAGALGRVAAQGTGAAVVHTFHSLPFNEFQSPWTHAALERIERRLGKLTDWFFAHGTFLASEAIRRGIAPPDRIRALMGPVQTVAPATAESRKHARKLLGIPEGIKVIGTVGRLERQKAPLDMVSAFAELDQPDVCLVWIGDGEMTEETKRFIAQKRVGDRFRLLGNRSDVPQLLPGLDVFAMSSLWEGVPCALIEAMTCGIPVAATAVSSVPEIVVSGRTGLLARPGDPASLKSALAFMLDSPPDAARMAAAARSHIEEQIGSFTIEKEFMGVYDSALARVRNGAKSG